MIRRVAWSAALAMTVARVTRAEDPIEVEVRGDSTALPPKEPSVAGSVIRAERLRAPGVQASDVLRTQPGVGVFETGGYGSLSTASLRGATAAQTPVYLAGIRLNDDVGGTADLSLVPLWLLNRIEIYRSHAPLAGDQLGLGGAIFFEPRRPKADEAGIGAMIGSFGTRAIWGRSSVGDEEAGALVAVKLDGAQNDYPYLSDGGTRFERSHDQQKVLANAATSTMDAWAMGSLRLGRGGRIDLVANDVEREQGLPAYRLATSRVSELSLTRRIAGINARQACGSGCEITTTTAAIFSTARYDDPLREVALGTSRLDIDAKRIEDSLLLRWSPVDGFSITPAIRGSVERLDIGATNEQPMHAERVFSRALLQAQWAISDVVTVRGLGSAECHGTSLNGTPPWWQPADSLGPTGGSKICNQVEPAGRMGAQIDLASVALLANVGRYARVPTLTELYGLSGPVRGNTALEPETGVSLEAGVRVAASPEGPLRGASIDLFGFVRYSHHLVSYQRSSIGYVRPYNLGSARVSGAELLVHYEPARFALFELAATALDSRNTSADGLVNDSLPYRPRLILVPRAELRSKLAPLPLYAGKLAVSYFYQSSTYGDPAGLYVIPEQGSLEVDAEVGAIAGHVTVRARIANLLNQTRSDLIGYPLPGRAGYVAMEAQW